MTDKIPKTQFAVQLTGPDQLKLNTTKPVPTPGPHQVLCQVEAVGLCFSDLKLLKQFDQHVRKSDVISGIDPNVLKEIPSYVPGKIPAVPGHETAVRVVAIGRGVTGIEKGKRYLVQTDYRWLRTANSNAALGYNFEGALQEFVLMDQRVITSPQGQSFLIPASEDLSAAAVALVEPWACVEDAYTVKERQALKAGGQLAIIADIAIEEDLLAKFLNQFGAPAKITRAKNVSQLPDAAFDDVIYFGSNPKTVESLFAKVAANGLFNIVLCSGSFGRAVNCAVGRVHYGGIRIIGTTGNDPAEAMKNIPPTGEIKKNDKINVVGAAGPMGVMHVIRNICQQVPNITVFAGDVDDTRLAALDNLSEPLASKNNITYNSYNPTKDKISEKFSYTVLMAPIPALVTQSVAQSGQSAIINIFAGIPAHVTASIDMDSYIKNGMYFIGTSGSTLDDMKIVLKKAESRKLDTNLSVAAVSGLDGAIEGIRAVENHSTPGKIIVYPKCKGLVLTTLQQLQDKLPQVAGHLDSGCWTANAEKALLALY
jgi:threonine dehydrogenase-like Zn-dependent dehydrogenase